MISQPVPPFFPVLSCPLVLGELQTFPFPDVVFHLFLCLPYLLLPFTVLCKIVLARPDERETWSYHCSLRLFTLIKRSSCGPIACWILEWTSSSVTWCLYEMHSILRQHLISITCILLWSSAVRVHDLQAYRKMDVTRKRISRILEMRKTTPVIQNWF